MIGVDQVVDEIADSFVSGEEVMVAAVSAVADPRLYGAVAPMHDPVPCAQALPLTEVVDVDLAGVAVIASANLNAVASPVWT